MTEPRRMFTTTCRQRSVMLRRHVARHPGDHIEPEVFERLEQLMGPGRTAMSYDPDRFALLLNAVLTAGLDAIEAGQARTEYTHRGMTLQLQRRG